MRQLKLYINTRIISRRRKVSKFYYLKFSKFISLTLHINVIARFAVKVVIFKFIGEKIIYI